MQLTLHADYALRVLLYLGSHPPGHVASTKEISKTYGISNNHLVRVVRTLSDKGYVAVSAGRSGGVSLAREAQRIRIGDVVRSAEINLRLVECFDAKTNTCPILAACELKPVLAQALDAFLSVLDHYTLADLLKERRGSRLARIFATAKP
jgi:Rrf2 family transcriptional regulator, nitric oxide-sensitive transcriptional repressor